MNDDFETVDERFNAVVAGLPHLEKFWTLLEVSHKESDRGTVLIHAQMLDELLKVSIEARLISHKDVYKLTHGFNAPIGSFSSRIVTALALGVVSEREYEELESIRKIRNKFAHSIEMSFSDQSVVDYCRSLTFSAPDSQEVKLDPRGKFLTAGSALILNLVNRAHYVAQERLSYRNWRV